MSRNIVLIGCRGVGKTTMAKKIGKKLNRIVLSTDGIFEDRFGAIGNYVAKNGWKSFRKIESKIIDGITSTNAVIDCGGGVVENENNIKRLRKNGVIFWLKAPVPKIIERIKDDKNRVSLTGKKSAVHEVEEVLAKRSPLYEKSADFVIDTGSKSLSKISEYIISLYMNSEKKTKVCVVIAEESVEKAISSLKKCREADIV
jgi:shikimate kinase